MREMHWSWADLTGDQHGTPPYVQGCAMSFLNAEANERARQQDAGPGGGGVVDRR